MSDNKTKTVHARMAEIKKELSETKIAKSGHNKFAGFKYHELSDFIEVINKLNLKHGVNDFVEIDEENKECRITLTSIEDSEDFYTIKTPFREAQMLAKGGAPSNVDIIQRMGSTITYNRRYLYMTAYNIQESDGVDNQEPVEKKPQEKPQPQPTQKTISNENLVKGINQVKKGDILFLDLEEKIKPFTLTKEQEALIEALKKDIQKQ